MRVRSRGGEAVNGPYRGVTIGSMVAVALMASGCQPGEAFGPPPSGVARQTTYRPGTLSVYMVATDRGTGASQLAEIVRSQVWPSEVVVGAQVDTSLSLTYMVKSGDSLAAIAAAHQVTLAALEATNPALGPAGGRSWNLIHPGDRVSIPAPQAGTQGQDFVVRRLPAGPTPPALLIPPGCPTSTTSFLHAQCEDAVRRDAQLDREREAAWWAAAAKQLRRAQDDLVGQLQGMSEAGPGNASPAGVRATALGDSIQIAANTLDQLAGRRVLVLSGVGDDSPPALRKGELSTIHLVVTGVTDPLASASWASEGTAAGAASTAVLSSALTQLNLATAVDPPERTHP
jgi:LysM repeat protein